MSGVLVADGSTWVDPDDWDGDTLPDFQLEEPAEADELESLFH